MTAPITYQFYAQLLESPLFHSRCILPHLSIADLPFGWYSCACDPLYNNNNDCHYVLKPFRWLPNTAGHFVAGDLCRAHMSAHARPHTDVRNAHAHTSAHILPRFLGALFACAVFEYQCASSRRAVRVRIAMRRRTPRPTSQSCVCVHRSAPIHPVYAGPPPPPLPPPCPPYTCVHMHTHTHARAATATGITVDMRIGMCLDVCMDMFADTCVLGAATTPTCPCVCGCRCTCVRAHVSAYVCM